MKLKTPVALPPRTAAARAARAAWTKGKSTTALPAKLPVQFTGTTGEYAAIYFTNFFLSILTLGIYSAWAKVRNKRYFYGNTSVRNAPFDFDAQAKSILLARLLLLSFLFVIYLIEGNLAMETTLVFGFSGWVVIFLLPLMAVRGRAFNWSHTLWRGVRFAYARRYLSVYAHQLCISIPQLIAVLLFLGWQNSADNPLWEVINPHDARYQGFLVLFCLHLILLWPTGTWWRHRIRINQLSFGKVQFFFDTALQSYYRRYVAHLVFSLVVGGGLSWLLISQSSATRDYAVMLPFALFILVGLVGLSYTGRVALLYWNGITTTDGSYLRAHFSPFKYAFFITLLNFFLRIFSFGALAPFARVRKWRFLASHLTLHASDELRQILAVTTNFETAIGAEASDFDGIDLDFGMI